MRLRSQLNWRGKGKTGSRRDRQAQWHLQAHDLRPELEAVEFEIHHDGLMDASTVIDAQTGKLRAMLPCSRPVDDGERIWCSYGGLTAVAHGYDFKPLHKAEQGIDLAFPARDPKYGDVMKPLFLREDGVAMKVDLATGKTVGQLVDTGTDEVFFEGGKLINADYAIQCIDPATGQVSEAGRNIYGLTLARADGGFYSYSLDEVTRVKLPWSGCEPSPKAFGVPAAAM